MLLQNGGDINMIEAEKETTTASIVSNNKFVDISEEVWYIGCLTSQLTIFQSYM